MIKTANDLINEFAKKYTEPYHRLSLMEKKGEIFQLKRGLYETERKADPLTLAASIVGPSYISYETALSYYDLIPERTLTCMSATFSLHKIKRFTNIFGTFFYQDVPSKVYPLGTHFIESQGRKIEIATKEKALCDTLCKAKPMQDEKELIEWLYSFMRMEETDILALDGKSIMEWAPLYKKRNIFLLAGYLHEWERQKKPSQLK
jgi:predicted transcriptional regulator of viral defense system